MENTQHANDRVDYKGLIWFLVLTFGITIAIAASLSGVRGNRFLVQYSLLSAMFVPALSSVIVRKFITNEGWGSAGLTWGGWKFYAKVWLTIPLLYLAVYSLTWLFGYQPDFTLKSFAEPLGLTLPLPATQLIVVLLLVTLTVASLINSVAAFGEELGWRGYLLPKLLPLGTRKALVIHGIIWGLWHAPFIWFVGFGNYPNPYLGTLCFTVLVMLVGIYFGYLRLISGSTLLPSFAHGMFNAQSYGLWPILFTYVDAYVGGIGGVAGILVFLVFDIYVLRKLPHVQVTETASSPE